MKKLLLLGFTLLVVISTVISVRLNSKAQSEWVNLVLSATESLASGEISGGSSEKSETPHDCSYTKNIIIEGSNQIITVTVPGKKGVCDGLSGTCNSWPCTEIM